MCVCVVNSKHFQNGKRNWNFFLKRFCLFREVENIVEQYWKSSGRIFHDKKVSQLKKTNKKKFLEHSRSFLLALSHALSRIKKRNKKWKIESLKWFHRSILWVSEPDFLWGHGLSVFDVFNFLFLVGVSISLWKNK